MALTLDEAQIDRAIGTLVAAACGDALGAGYEFETAEPDGRPQMIGGGLGGFAPGEWTDDTAQTYAIARIAATGANLHEEAALDGIAQGFADWWASNPPDAGVHTRRVLGSVGRNPTAADLLATSCNMHDRFRHTAGNGTLMRTAPVALAHLDDPGVLIESAGKIARLTHYDAVGGEACALWCLAIRHSVLEGELPQLIDLVDYLPLERREFWRGIVLEAEDREPRAFNPNGFVVHALQAAWSAIVHTNGREDHLIHGIETAVTIGNDTDTVAAITGALLGARYGHSAIPSGWHEIVHGWPSATASDLAELARGIVARHTKARD